MAHNDGTCTYSCLVCDEPCTANRDFAGHWCTRHHPGNKKDEPAWTVAK